MIGLLRGKLAAEEPNGALIVDVSGVGYEVMTPLGTVGRTRCENGEHTLWIHTHVREDSLDLFGFCSEIERRVFRLLITVPNVGPKTALGVLSALPPPDLAAAVHSGDMARLNKIPGVGKKTAERLVLELKEKLPKFFPDPEPTTRPSERPDMGRRLVLALTSMGYKPAEAERAVAALGPSVTVEPMDRLLREALTRLTS